MFNHKTAGAKLASVMSAEESKTFEKDVTDFVCSDKGKWAIGEYTTRRYVLVTVATCIRDSIVNDPKRDHINEFRDTFCKILAAAFKRKFDSGAHNLIEDACRILIRLTSFLNASERYHDLPGIKEVLGNAAVKTFDLLLKPNDDNAAAIATRNKLVEFATPAKVNWKMWTTSEPRNEEEQLAGSKRLREDVDESRVEIAKERKDD